ncbi:hypothetical protein PN36_25560 [Candidatus Thiomargarita nelsonii]|uniref:Uncharacterized protein n=1 Tax=Candidatus Thiomargarita nelsonii TaxID=1003181 RepID=A0A4E0R0B8_9GAMM|nr:hypothetical protein PN36_25560 [Candidatus Thiomargarita nelsonii]
MGYEYDATQSIVLAKEQLEELKFVAYADEQTPLLQIEIKSLEGRIHATEGTLLYRRAQYSDAAFYLRGELAEAKEKFDKQYPGARSHALRLLKKAEQLLQETIAASERLMERVDVDDDEKEYIKQRALVEQEILGTIRCRIGELLTLNEQFQEKEEQLGALQYLEQALEDTQVRGKTYHWAEVVNNYLTAHYFAGDETVSDQKVLTYEKQLEEIGVFKERYPIFFGKLRLTQGNIIFSRYFQHSHGNVKKLRQMLRDYVESCEFMARTGSAQFSLAIRVLIVRIRMIRHKKTLEEIKKGLSGIWLDQPHLKKEELVTLIEFIQTMQNIIGYDVQG